jgi:hypothetical protein
MKKISPIVITSKSQTKFSNQVDPKNFPDSYDVESERFAESKLNLLASHRVLGFTQIDEFSKLKEYDFSSIFKQGLGMYLFLPTQKDLANFCDGKKLSLMPSNVIQREELLIFYAWLRNFSIEKLEPASCLKNLIHKISNLMPEKGVTKTRIDYYLTSFILSDSVVNEFKSVDLWPELCARAYERDHEIRTVSFRSHDKTVICCIKHQLCFEVFNYNYMKPGVGLPCDVVDISAAKRRIREEGESRIVQKERRGGALNKQRKVQKILYGNACRLTGIQGVNPKTGKDLTCLHHLYGVKTAEELKQIPENSFRMLSWIHDCYHNYIGGGKVVTPYSFIDFLNFISNREEIEKHIVELETSKNKRIKKWADRYRQLLEFDFSNAKNLVPEILETASFLETKRNS